MEMEMEDGKVLKTRNPTEVEEVAALVGILSGGKVMEWWICRGFGGSS